MSEPRSDGLLDDRWDCVVIGSGLAGSMAARQSALAGLKTLLVERQEFPRSKVCGACLNHRALSALKSVSLASTIDELGGVPIDSFMLRGFGSQFQRELPAGVAVSRSRLDSALMTAARDAGATVLTSVRASLMPSVADAPTRIVRLQPVGTANRSSPKLPPEVQASVVIAADGLGHPSLKSSGDFAEERTRRSRVGIGASIDRADDAWSWVRPGCIHMAAAREGYGGIVRVENGGVNLAAAVDRALLKAEGSPHAAFDRLLRSAGFPSLPTAELDWRGTPALTRMITQVVDHRVFVVGDAAGYIEPFTGEGMAWALIGGRAVAQSASICITDGHRQGAEHWHSAWSELVRRRQRWCRRLAWLLRHPTAAALGLSLATRFPRVTNRIVHQLNAEQSA